MSRTIASTFTTLAVLGAAVVVLGVLALARSAGAASPANRDPLAAAAVVSFRQSEHASAIDNRDPLAAPGLAAFRQSEHAVQTTVRFSDSERAENYGPRWSSDPLAEPNIVRFRASEHTEAAR
jgi:hypothetical protein